MALQGEAKKAYQRELMRKRREAVKLGLVETETVSDAATVETGVVTPEAGEGITEKEEEPRRTRTDTLFENDRPDYYIFDQDVREGRCWRCSKAFRTQMELNKFCSPKCKNGYLDEAFGKMKVGGV